MCGAILRNRCRHLRIVVSCEMPCDASGSCDISGARMRRRPREAAFVRNCGGACGAAVDPVQR